MVARHVNKANGGQTTNFGGQCSVPLTSCSRCNISGLSFFLSFLLMQSHRQRQLTPQATWQYNATVTRLLRIHFVLKSVRYLKRTSTSSAVHALF